MNSVASEKIWGDVCREWTRDHGGTNALTVQEHFGRTWDMFAYEDDFLAGRESPRASELPGVSCQVAFRNDIPRRAESDAVNW